MTESIHLLSDEDHDLWDICAALHAAREELINAENYLGRAWMVAEDGGHWGRSRYIDELHDELIDLRHRIGRYGNDLYREYVEEV